MAILPFTGGQNEEGETIAEIFSFEPELTAVFNPVPRTTINRAIRSEQHFQVGTSLTDPDTVVALGERLGTQYVVSGSIAALGTSRR
jgi:TolB-like protein